MTTNKFHNENNLPEFAKTLIEAEEQGQQIQYWICNAWSNVRSNALDFSMPARYYRVKPVANEGDVK